MQESAAAAGGGYAHQPLGMPPRPLSQPGPPLRPTALVAPGHFTLLPPSAQYVCQPPVPMTPSPYRLLGQELPMISGLTYQLMAPHPQAPLHPGSGGATTVQLIPATPVGEVYPSSQQYLQPPESASAAEADPVLHLGVDPKSAAPMYGPPVDPTSYQVVISIRIV